MKKNLLTIILALLIGFLMTKFTFNQYKSDYTLKTVFNSDEEVIFLKYKTVESLDGISIDTNYIYSQESNQYHIYIGITSNEENAKKLKDLYQKKEYILSETKISINNKKFIELLKQYDNLLKEVTDETVIDTINRTILEKYKELVINEYQD